MRPNWIKITDPADPEFDAGNPRYWAPWAGALNGSEIGPEGHNDPAAFGTFVEDLNADATKYPSGRRYVWRPL